ncbi:MAG: hypothetical protein VKJ06_07835 [Vampirovibrionales bacterium]|nr:hypothetical protein [Vampirovibrionales bacterium]
MTPETHTDATSSHCCPNCSGRYFKTLEIRYAPTEPKEHSPPALPLMLLYKQRCKRCKFKWIFKKTPALGWQLGTWLLWPSATRVASRESPLLKPRKSKRDGPVFLEHRAFVSEYTARLSHGKASNGRYLKKIEALEKKAPRNSRAPSTR